MKHSSSQAPADLAKNGPIIRVSVLPHPKARSESEDPSPVKARFLLDTGAELSFVEKGFAETLGLRPLRFAPIKGISHKPEDCAVYLMTIRMDVMDGQNSVSYVDHNATVVGMRCPPDWQGLLGRDFLRRLRVIYDGTKGIVELHVPPSRV